LGGQVELDLKRLRSTIVSSESEGQGSCFAHTCTTASALALFPKIEITSLGNGEITENRRGGLDLSELPDVSGESDYDAVPVHAYGKALLRGLGWEEGQPIGKNVKNIVAPVVTAPRPKGLGLGAQIVKPPAATKDNSSAGKSKNIKKEEELVLKVGSYFKTVKEEYGEIVGLDEDNARIMGRLTLSKSTVTLSQHGVRLVTKEEYEKFSKLINKEKYDKYKKEEDEKESRRMDKLKNDNERKTDEDEKKSRQRDDPKRDNEHKKESKRRNAERDRSPDRRRTSKNDTGKRS